MRPIGFTAQVIAAARARESARPGALFNDPFAAALATPEAFALLDRAPRRDGPDGLALRTRRFDDYLVDAQGPIVIVAAGMDTRAFRLPLPASAHVFELDFPDVLDEKARILAAATPVCPRTTIPCDLLAPGWPERLVSAGLDPARPSTWLVEGLLAYLEPQQIHALLQAISSLAAPGSRLACDFMSRGALESPSLRAFHERLASTPFRFATDWPEDLLERQGWTPSSVEQSHEVAARYGLEVPPPPARSVPHVPRSFFVFARR